MKHARKTDTPYLQFMIPLFPFIFWACEPSYDNLLTSPADLPPAIFAFLNTARDSQYVILRNSLPAQDMPDAFIQSEHQRLRLASIRLSDGAGDFVIHDSYEVYFAAYESLVHSFVFVSAHPVSPSETYKLKIEIPEKGVYTGSTTAPGDFQFLAPNALDTINVFEPLSVRWTPSERAAGYRVVFQWTMLDSTRFKSGSSDEIDKQTGRVMHYVESSTNPSDVWKHSLDFYYRFPDSLSFTPDKVISVFVEALDPPAWLARDLNQRGGIIEFEKEIRLVPGSYSNIAGGLGLMSAIVTREISLVLPERRQHQ